MPRLVTIGHTIQDDIKLRLNQLYSTGVPFPFQVEYAARVPNPEEVANALHQAFGPNRVNPKRQFFDIDPSQAIAILKLLHVEDATREIGQLLAAVSQQEAEAAELYRGRRPVMNFVEMGIPLNSVLSFTDGSAAVRVCAPKHVDMEGVEMSLAAATRHLLGLPYEVAPGPFWTYQGKTVREIYNDTYL
jgi:hypothetical protein